MKRTIKMFLISHFLQMCFAYAQIPQWRTYVDGNNVTTIAVEGESVWIGFDYSGIAYLDNPAGSLIYYNTENSDLPENRVKSIAVDSEGIKWIGTRGGGLAKFDEENWTVYNRDNSDIPDDRVQAVAIDDSGNKWLGFRGEGVAKFDGQNWTVYNDFNSDLPHYEVNCIAIDDSNNKWIGCDHNGLAKFNGESWTTYNSATTGLELERILCITFDSSGNKWIGTEYGGVVMFDNSNWHNYNVEIPNTVDGLIPSIAIDAMDNKWICGWYSGFTRYNSASQYVYTPDNSGLPHINTTVVAIDNMNNKWIGTETGLSCFNEDGVVSIKDNNGFPPDYYILKHNYPNPFNPITTIEYILPLSNKISLKIYNPAGQEIATLIDGYQTAGEHRIIWKPKDVASGIYFCRLQAGEFIDTKKLIFQK
jgi:ligand-binding sensor domain-containing protein